jgi:hypothetical protein
MIKKKKIYIYPIFFYKNRTHLSSFYYFFFFLLFFFLLFCSSHPNRDQERTEDCERERSWIERVRSSDQEFEREGI